MGSTAALELLVQLNDKASDGLDDIADKGGGMGDAIKGGALIAGGAILALGGFLAGAAKAASDEETGIAQLNTTLKNSIPNWDGNTDAVEAYITKQQQLAFSDDELRSSLAFLVGQTGDMKEAQDLQSTAMDLARAKGIDLATATKAVGKVDQESIGILKKLGVTVTDHMTKEEALAAIREQTAGQAQAFADTSAGAATRMQNAMGDMMETIGGAVLDVVGGPLQDLADWFTSPEVQAGIQDIAAAVKDGLKVAFDLLGGAITIVSGIFTTLQPVFETVFNFIRDNATPILIGVALALTAFAIPAFIGFATTLMTVTLPALFAIAAPVIAAAAPFIALAAVVGALWLAFDSNFLGIRDLVVPIVSEIITAVSAFWTEMQPKIVEAWNAISSTAVTVWGFIQSTIVAGVLALVEAWNTNWGGIQTIVQGAWDVISGIVTVAWELVSGIISAGLSLLSGDWETAWTTIQTMLSSVWTTITDVILPGALTLIWTLLTEFVPKLLGVLLEWTGAFFDWVWKDLLPQLPGWLWNIVSAVWTFVSENAPKVLAKLGEWTTAFFDWVMKDVVPQIPTWLGNIATALWTWVTGAAKALSDKLFNEWIPSMWEWITGKGGVVETIGTKMAEIWTAITTWIGKTATDILTAVKTIGDNIVQGIKDGISGAWDAFTSWVTGLLGGMVDAVKKFFGISSPSRMMADYVGKPLAEGIGVGFGEGFTKVTSDVLTSMGSLMTALSGEVHSLADTITGDVNDMTAAFKSDMAAMAAAYDAMKERLAHGVSVGPVTVYNGSEGQPSQGGSTTPVDGRSGTGTGLNANAVGMPIGGGMTGGGQGTGNIYITVYAGLGTDGTGVGNMVADVLEDVLGARRRSVALSGRAIP